MSTDLSYNTDPKHSDYLLQSLEAGILGRFFGSKQSAASSIAWVVSFTLIIAGVIVWFKNGPSMFVEYWKTVGPFLTLSLGFLFGTK